MKVTLVLPADLAETLKSDLAREEEVGAVLLAKPVRTPRGDLRLLGRAVRRVPTSAYAERTATHLVIRSEGFVPPLAEAEAEGAVAVWTHTHPGDGSSPQPSEQDRLVDAQLADVFRLRTGAEYYGALILAPGNGPLRFTGHLNDGSGELPIDCLLVVGPSLEVAVSDARVSEQPAPIFDRQIRAFGGAVQSAIRELEFALVGCGGTGSAVAEQLVRLGARRFQLFDPDTVSISNLTRMYGAFPSDVGRPKTDVVAAHLKRIAPDATISSWNAAVTREAVAKELMNSDVVFGCTDDNAGRLVLSRLSSYFLMPVIDVGVVLSSGRGGAISGIDGRVTVLHPGAACLVCRQRIDLQRASAELMSAEEHASLVREGYAPALPGVEPAVGSYTTLVASLAVAELLERLVHYGDSPTPSELLVRIHDREMSTNECAPAPGHYCDPAAGLLGWGLTEPFLDQTWSS